MNKIETLIKELCPNGVEWKELGNICTVKTGKGINKNFIQANPGEFPVVNSGKDPLGFVNIFNTVDDPIGITSRGAGVGYVSWNEGNYFRGNLNYSATIKDKSKLSARFLYFYLKNNSVEIEKLCTFNGIPALNKENLEKLTIPIPPLEIQEEIVKILDKFTDYVTELTTELTLRQKQYHYYRDKLLAFDNEEVEWKTLNEISTNMDNLRRPVTKTLRNNGIYPYYGASGIVDYVGEYIFEGNFLLVSEDGANLKVRNTPIAFSISGKNWVNNHAHVLKFNNLVTQKFVEYYLNSIDLSNYISGAAQPKLNQKNLNMIKIPHPTLERQEQIVSVLNTFEKLCNDIINGLPKEIELRQKQYEYYRDKLLSFD